ncbi:MAG TPA: hypothetical protein VFI03_00160 [Solirubrobacterales bacterium]|nr:hypothetical protein [Solirubrobacterales bacterium]
MLGAVLGVSLLFSAEVGSAAPGSADLRIAKTDSPDPVAAGSVLNYAIEVDNLGPNAATGVTVTDQLPKNVDLVSATASGGQCALKGRKVTCSLETVPVVTGTYATGRAVSIAVIPRRVGSIVNTASVKGGEKDPVASNNKATATTLVTGPPRTCGGLPVTILGTRGSDTLVGSGGPDVIASFGGDDTIFAFGGQDLICAGPGRDFVGAGTAADRVFGASGGDRLLGRGGPDLLKGNAGNDVLKGNRGDDRLRGGSGFDRCQGGPGRNSIRGCER